MSTNASDPADRSIAAGGPVPRSARDVFVIHGRDEQLRERFFQFLRDVDLRPLGWETIVKTTGTTSPSLLQVIKIALERAQAIVVLLAPDDVVQLHPLLHEPRDPEAETTPTMQPRPNVLIELGMALGSCDERTIIVEIGDLRPVADLGGLNVIRLDNGERSSAKLVQRLKSAGCAVDDSGGDWNNARRFSDLEAHDRVPVFKGLRQRNGNIVSNLAA